MESRKRLGRTSRHVPLRSQRKPAMLLLDRSVPAMLLLNVSERASDMRCWIGTTWMMQSKPLTATLGAMSFCTRRIHCTCCEGHSTGVVRRYNVHMAIFACVTHGIFACVVRRYNIHMASKLAPDQV